MKRQNILMLLLTMMGMTSCVSNLYQVYEVKSPDLKQNNNSMVYENDDCRILYNLWCEDGSMQFIFQNKTDKDLFVDMNQTFFIKNGAAYNYFDNRTYQTQTTSTLEYGYSTSNIYWSNGSFWPHKYILNSIGLGYKEKVALSKGVSTKEEEIVCIPANSYKVFKKYSINAEFIKKCDKKIDYPKKQSIVETYNELNTPLTFKNRISYSFSKSGEELHHIENTFWLSAIKNYSRKEAVEKTKEKLGCSEWLKKTYYFKIGGPNQFYKKYRMAKEIK